jgi:hypothetical protein
MSNLFVVIHVFAVFALISGIVGRNVTRGQAVRAADIAAFKTLSQLAHVFDMMVRHSSLGVLVTGLLAAWLRGWPILGPLQGSPILWPLTALVTYLTMVPLIVLVYLPKLKVFEARLADAEAKGVVTPELRAASQDPLVRSGHIYEMIVIAFLVWLMVAKPF